MVSEISLVMGGC